MARSRESLRLTVTYGKGLSMKRLPVVILVAAALTPLGAGVSFAGQPNASCEDPGANPPAGFSSGGFENAESHYAGEDDTPSLAHANSSHAVSQYDIACFRGSTR
jgi:hypothetical protein